MNMRRSARASVLVPITSTRFIEAPRDRRRAKIRRATYRSNPSARLPKIHKAAR